MAQSGRSILESMALVALFAFDCVTFRILRFFSSSYLELASLIFVAILPMANVLAIGILPLLRRNPTAAFRPFRVGFLSFGGFGLLFVTAGVLLASRPIYLTVTDAVAQFVPRWRPSTHIVVPLFLLPQLGFALLGGWLNDSYRITIQVERRRPGHESGPDAGPRALAQGSLP